MKSKIFEAITISLILLILVAVNIVPSIAFAQPNLTDSVIDIKDLKPVTDEDAITLLESKGYNVNDIGLLRDYGEKENDNVEGVDFTLACSQTYYHTKTKEFISTFSQLPMVDANNDSLDLRWINRTGYFDSGENLFICVVDDLTTSIVVENDQFDGKRNGNTLTYTPQLFLGGKEIQPISETPSILAIDPFNENYNDNVLVWDYGICKRYLRLIEGKILGSWSFEQIPKDSILIRYNQTGSFNLNLGQYQISPDEEFITVEQFESFGSDRGSLYVIGDSMTFYPDASPESTSVDGYVWRSGVGELWADLIINPGNNSNDSDLTPSVQVAGYGSGSRWSGVWRSVMLFDTSALPDDCTIDSSTLSIRARSKGNNSLASPYVNIYASDPASNTALVDADYNVANWGDTAFSDTSIAHADWTLGVYEDFKLNSSGITAISKIGITKFGMRDVEYDAGATPPPDMGGSTGYWFGWHPSDKGAGYKPTLVVVYNEGPPEDTFVPKPAPLLGGGNMMF